MRHSNRFYSSLGLLIILNVIIKPVWIFAIDRQVQNAVGNTLYGTYFSLFNLTLMGGFLLDWGISSYMNRQMAAGKNSVAVPASRFLYLKLLFTGIYIAIMLMLALLSGTQRMDILGWAIAIQALTSFFIFLRGIITAQQWFRTDAWLSVLDKTLMIIVCGGFLYLPSVAGGISLEKFLIAQAASTALAIGATYGLLYKNGFRFAGGEIPESLRTTWKAALPYALIILLMTIHYRLDGFLLALMKNNYEAGVYAAAYRLLDAANMVGYLAAGFLLPYIARRASGNNEYNETVLDVRHGLMLFSLTVVILFFFWSGWFNEILYNNPGRASAEVLQWCLVALPGYSLVQVYGTVLTATGHIVAFGRIALWAMLLNAALNIALIPLLGALGSCAAAIISQSVFGLSAFLLARKKCGLSPHAGSWRLYIFIGGVVTGAAYGFRQTEMNPIVQILLTLLTVGVVAMATRLVSVKKWTSLFPGKVA